MTRKPIIESLEELIGNLLDDAAMPQTKMTQDDKLAVIDRALKLGTLKMKQEEGMGRGFDWGGDDDT
jgi:hypothetical protein